MKRFFIISILFAVAIACRDEDVKDVILEYPKVYSYNGPEFIGNVQTYNSSGRPVKANSTFPVEKFLFSDGRGIYPTDKIEIISESDANFYFSHEEYSFIKQGKYTVEGNKINFEVDFGNAEMLTVSADYVSDAQLLFKAFGVITYGANDNGFQIISYVADFGEPDVSKFLKYSIPSDTLFIQTFNEWYQADQ